MFSSAIYTGFIKHQRFTPVEHRFQYRIAMPLIDLAELPLLFKVHPLYMARKRFAPIGLQRRDYLSGKSVSLIEEARKLVGDRIGKYPQGPVRLLTNFCYFGLTMNPVSFYYLYDEAGSQVEAMIAEVTNTPWRQRHSYVFDTQQLEHRAVKKELHVSPFMPLDQSYTFDFSPPGKTLTAAIENYQSGKNVFRASLTLSRRPWSRRELTRLLVAYPPMSFSVALRIYWNALQLKLKSVPHYKNPHGSSSHSPVKRRSFICARKESD